MYYPVLRNGIQSAEEKMFYNIAIMYLKVLGYKNVSIVDGSGDGGRDVICSRAD